MTALDPTVTGSTPTVPGASPEAFRPELHFAARDTWLNDPNGLIYHGGLFHLYFQNNPFGNVWGNMSWGHATSADLVTWREHPVAIPCDEREDVFSGSVVFDAHNTSGLGTSDQPPLVAVYTSAFRNGAGHDGIQAQSIAFSLDGGYRWTKHAGNPVLSRASPDFRDPKVFWYSGEGSSYWVLVAVEATQHLVVLYRSDDLLAWEHLSDFGPANATGGVWECPDLFPLPVRDEPGASAWVLTVNLSPGGPNGGSAGQYFVGDFDGVSFTPHSTVPPGPDDGARLREYGWLDWGRDFYAAVAFTDAPDDRRILLGWMNNWEYANEIPTSPWRSAMSLPRELSLVRTAAGLRLAQRVPAEVERAAFPAFAAERTPVDLDVLVDEVRAVPAPDSVAMRIDATFRPGSATEFGLVVRGAALGGSDDAAGGTRIGIRPGEGVILLDRTRSGDTGFSAAFPSVETAPVAALDGAYRLTVYTDRCSVEVFAEDGLVTLTDLVFPAESATAISVYASGGDAEVTDLRITAAIR
ncbi:glycoside hydrolase family 32 protein [Planctomonas deserti]|uniref:glycoside hydrolase family 32 protein n=1 Tax=Planctomonas deserti TaxID=2144185 RepID=UPI000D3BDF5B|nr:glycoside hydrolase family 32 protein [Planctomonas deserti]